VQWQGDGDPHVLHPGDWWHVTPDVPHWHDATMDSTFAHLAVTSGGSTRWLGP
jgi:quercetin dioxygenase-like cupin family protein